MNREQNTINKILPWLIWGIGSLYFLFDYINQVIPSVISQGLQASFHLNSTAIGVIAAVYFLSYASLQIPIGLIIDYFGPKKPLLIAACFASIGCVLFAYASQEIMLIVLRISIGACTGFSFVCCLKLVSNWFDSKYFGSMTGLTNIVGMFGAILAQETLAKLTVDFSWRTTMLALGIFGFILLLLIFFIVKNKPNSSKVLPNESKRGVQKSWNDIKHVFMIKDFWLVGIYAATINTAFAAVGALWGVSYLVITYKISMVEAAIVSSLLFIGGIAGSITVGWVSDRLKLRKLPMIICALGALLCMVLILYFSVINLIVVKILFFLLGFFASGNVLAYAYGHDIRPAGSAGISLGFVNMWLIGGSALSQPLVGWLIDEFKSYGIGAQMSYVYGLSVVTFFMALALVICCFLKETHAEEIHCP